MMVIGLAVLAFIAIDAIPFAALSKMESLPWYITRSSALSAYGLMFFVVVLGTGMTTSFAYRFVNPVRAWTIHKYLSITMTFLVFFHMFSLLFDKWLKFRLLDLFVPYAAGSSLSTVNPLYLSLGIVGFYLLLITMLVSIFLRLRTPRFWRATHYFVYPLFAMSLIHGLFLGTDSKATLMQGVYWFTGAVFIALLIYRFIFYRATLPARTP